MRPKHCRDSRRPGEPFEEFELLSLLGKGGTSRVFLAETFPSEARTLP